jgi:DNA-binding transcriptional MerR regulator
MLVTMQSKADLRSSYDYDGCMNRNDLIPIGALARRTGLAVSAIRYYEQRGLIRSVRSSGNQRRFLRSDIRRLSFILIAQKLGLGLAEIERELAALPQGRTPSARLGADQPFAAGRDRPPHRHAGAHARKAGRLHRLRLPQPGAMPALQSGGPCRGGRCGPRYVLDDG